MDFMNASADSISSPIRFHNVTLQELNHEEAMIRIPAIIYTIILMFVGLFGNTIACYIYSFRLKMSPANCFIIVLEVLDLINCCIGMPTEIVDMLYPLMFPSLVACKLLKLLTFFSSGTSGLILVVIAVDRYNRASHPFKRQITIRKAKIISFVIVCIGLCLSLPMLYLSGKGTYVTRIPDIKGFDCSISDSKFESALSKVYFGTAFLLMVSSFVAISIYYILLVRKIRNSRSKPADDSANGTPEISWSTSERSATRETTCRKTLNRTNLTLFSITLLFMLSYTPPLFLLLIRCFINYKDTMNTVAKLFHSILMRFHFLSCSLNPIVYGYWNKSFRREFSRIPRHCLSSKKQRYTSPPISLDVTMAMSPPLHPSTTHLQPPHI